MFLSCLQFLLVSTGQGDIFLLCPRHYRYRLKKEELLLLKKLSFAQQAGRQSGGQAGRWAFILVEVVGCRLKLNHLRGKM